MLFKRTGRFRIQKALIEEQPIVVYEVLSFLRFVPLEVTYNTGTQHYEYMGTSPKFDQISYGEPEPKYDIHLETKESGQIYQITVKRVISFQS